MLKKSAKIGGAVGVGWLALAGTVAAMQGRLLFKPEHAADGKLRQTDGHRLRAVSLRTTDDTRLSGWLLTPRNAAKYPTVVYFGGRSEDVYWITQDAQRIFPGMSVLAINYRGYGKSQGKPSEAKIIEDATYLIDWLVHEKRVDVADIALVGRSLGSGVAVQVASKRAVGATVLITPYDSIAAVAKDRFPWVPNFVLRHRFDSMKVASSITCPVMVLRAQDDQVITPSHTDRLVSGLSSPPLEICVPNSDHANIPYLPTTQNLIAEFLSKKFGTQPVGHTRAGVSDLPVEA